MNCTYETKLQEMALKGIVSELPEENREAVLAAVKELRALLEQHGESGLIALAIVGLELQDKT